MSSILNIRSTIVDYYERYSITTHENVGKTAMYARADQLVYVEQEHLSLLKRDSAVVLSVEEISLLPKNI